MARTGREAGTVGMMRYHVPTVARGVVSILFLWLFYGAWLVALLYLGQGLGLFPHPEGVAFVGGLAAGAVTWWGARGWWRNRRWRRLARDMDLELADEMGAFRGATEPDLEGTRQGYTVRLCSERRGTGAGRPVTALEVEIPGLDPDFEMTIRPRSRTHAAVNTLVGGLVDVESVEVEDPGFAEEYWVEGTDPHRIRGFLDAPTRAAVEAIPVPGELRLKDGVLRYVLPARRRDPDTWEPVLDVVLGRVAPQVEGLAAGASG